MFRKFNIASVLLILIFITAAIYLVSRNGNEKIYYESASTQNISANNKITETRRTVITETVAKISPAVVGINVTEIRQFRDPFFSPFFDDPFFRQFFGGDRTSTRKVKSLGSGFLISPDGYILTNDHVAGNAVEVVITLTNGKHFNAKVIGTDPVSDICLLKIDENDLPYLLLGNSNEILIGEWAIALGNPFGLFDLNDKPTVTVGVVSALGMNLDPVNNRYYLNMIQTDAAINGGNSGGPLVNSIGEVIGMNTLIISPGSGQGSIGLGFAIPINKVKKIVDELKSNGKIERDFYTGIKVQNIDETISKYFKLETTKGVIITRIEKNSPADKAGLESGDIITQIDDYKINNEQTLVGVLQEYRTNQTITLGLIRNNKEIKKNMKLDRRP
ncbi:MAG TPA: trypsin-like peptidase domain-containing protein [Ignavibacteriaceae bacterium]|nr:trypsin-like peptidase domain-containing protein [Ignavibacteriaceae bacterium]